jgi:hypothetical protein
VSAETDVMQFPKPGSMCSDYKEDCSETGCCKTTGQKCWAKNSKSAFCKLECPKGWDCADLTQTREYELEVMKPGTSLYCYALAVLSKSFKSKTPDDQLLGWQLKNGKGIFACQAWDVFSDVPLTLNGEYDAIQLKDTDGDWFAYTREDTGTPANTAIFVSAWKLIRQRGWDQEWVVKADADAVFIPQRLQDVLSVAKHPNTGIYYENCKGVDSGFFGSLEVVSTLGFKILTDKLEECKSTLAWDGDPSSGWKYGPWGEDKFAQECMDRHGVLKMQGFELTYDGACPSDRPEGQKKNKKFVPPCWNSSAPVTHPFKSVKAWTECLDTTLKVTA